MTKPPLDYESRSVNRRRPMTADIVVLCITLAYASANIVLMLRYARSPIVFIRLGVIAPFWIISSVGTMTAFPLCLTLRRCGITWRSGLATTLTFAALTLFNFWCFLSA